MDKRLRHILYMVLTWIGAMSASMAVTFLANIGNILKSEYMMIYTSTFTYATIFSFLPLVVIGFAIVFGEEEKDKKDKIADKKEPEKVEKPEAKIEDEQLSEDLQKIASENEDGQE